MIKIDSLLREREASLRKKVKKYRAAALEIKAYLDKHPHEWGRFQSDFNREINGIFRDIMDFEKERLTQGDENSVYKLKRIFVNRLRKDFLHGEYIKWSYEKPYGHPGDFKIIDEIYTNSPKSVGFERLHDNYYQMTSICNAVRNRKEDFKKIISAFVEKHSEIPLRIMNLAAGPCRDLKELLFTEPFRRQGLTFDCFDQDERAIQYGESLLKGCSARINFIRENVLRIALKKNVESQITNRYELIYITGLFDYLDRRIATRLVQNIKKILKLGGLLAVSDVRDKYQNPSVHFMEWVGDWNLVYRSDEEFKQIFLDSNFRHEDLKFESEQQGIMQYILATGT